MDINYGNGKTKYGPGVSINLDASEVATAILAYLIAHDVYIDGPRTITVNGDLCKTGHIYVDPVGFVLHNGIRFSFLNTSLKYRQKIFAKAAFVHIRRGAGATLFYIIQRKMFGCSNGFLVFRVSPSMTHTYHGRFDHFGGSYGSGKCFHLCGPI
jgi:hypothetical protein